MCTGHTLSFQFNFSEQLDEVFAKFVRSEELVRYYETQSRELTGSFRRAFRTQIVHDNALTFSLYDIGCWTCGDGEQLS